MNIKDMLAVDIETVGNESAKWFDTADFLAHRLATEALSQKEIKELTQERKKALAMAQSHRGGLNFWENRIGAIGFCAYAREPEIVSLANGDNIQNEFNMRVNSTSIICHNSVFESVHFSHHLHSLPIIGFDTFIAEKILTSGLGLRCDLGSCVERYFEISLQKDKELRVAPWHSKVSPETEEYLRNDVRYLHSLAARQWEELQKEGLVETFLLEMECLQATVKMSLAGIAVDKDKLEAYIRVYEKLIEEYKTDLLPAFGDLWTEKLLNSPIQLRNALKHLFGLFVESTDVKTLAKYAKQNDTIATLFKYRKAVKVYGTYLLPFQEEIKYDGRLRGSWNQLGTETGRYSSSRPNMQNIPAHLRDIFVPEAGNVFVNADLSQIEPRILAELSGDERFIQMFLDGEDPYIGCAKLMFSITEVTKKQRNDVKAIKLGLMYEKSAWGLAQTLGISEEEAKRLYSEYHGAFTKISKFRADSIEEAHRELSVRSAGGRIRYLWDMRASQGWKRKAAVRKIVNTKIQGSAASGNKQALIRLAKQLPNEAKLVATIHDEVLVECPLSLVDEIKLIVQQCMIEGNKVYLKTVPVVCEPKIIANWAEGKD